MGNKKNPSTRPYFFKMTGHKTNIFLADQRYGLVRKFDQEFKNKVICNSSEENWKIWKKGIRRVFGIIIRDAKSAKTFLYL